MLDREVVCVFQGNRIGVVVPAYNEDLLIAPTVRSIPPYVDRIYVVNDGSRDRTYDIVSEICRQDDRLVLINHETNKGVGAAIATGYRRCLQDDLDIAVVMAGDNQMVLS
jgi:glycosyltransferase involved in cell wall biosynthesis